MKKFQNILFDGPEKAMMSSSMFGFSLQFFGLKIFKSSHNRFQRPCSVNITTKLNIRLSFPSNDIFRGFIIKLPI